MKNFSLSLTTRQNFDLKVNQLLSQNPNLGYFVNITKKKKKRSLTSNAQMHVWYKQIADYHGDRTALSVKNMCKDMFGLPILFNSDHSCEQIEFLLHHLNYYKRSYENRLKLIQCISVTSLFNVPESKEYMDNMIFYFNDLGIPINYQDE